MWVQRSFSMHRRCITYYFGSVSFFFFFLFSPLTIWTNFWPTSSDIQILIFYIVNRWGIVWNTKISTNKMPKLFSITRVFRSKSFRWSFIEWQNNEILNSSIVYWRCIPMNSVGSNSDLFLFYYQKSKFVQNPPNLSYTWRKWQKQNEKRTIPAQQPCSVFEIYIDWSIYE